MNKPLGYIASPYSQGDKEFNVAFQMGIFDHLIKENQVTPYIPLIMHYQNQEFYLPEEKWIDYDISLIKQIPFKWLIRFNVYLPKVGYTQKESTGADNEVCVARQYWPDIVIITQRDNEWPQETILRLYKELSL